MTLCAFLVFSQPALLRFFPSFQRTPVYFLVQQRRDAHNKNAVQVELSERADLPAGHHARHERQRHRVLLRAGWKAQRRAHTIAATLCTAISESHHKRTHSAVFRECILMLFFFRSYFVFRYFQKKLGRPIHFQFQKEMACYIITQVCVGVWVWACGCGCGLLTLYIQTSGKHFIPARLYTTHAVHHTRTHATHHTHTTHTTHAAHVYTLYTHTPLALPPAVRCCWAI